jgi:hypothetical protein
VSPESDSWVEGGPTRKSSAPRTLYRPVGLLELNLILDSDARAFPPRLPEQPIFYPVLNFEYAEQIASRWNPFDPASGFAGYVTDFDVDADFVRLFEVKKVGEAAKHRELWIPADQLPQFNAHLRSRIRTRAAFYGPAYLGPAPLAGALEGEGAEAQLETLSEILHYSVFEFATEIEANWRLVLANLGFWSATPAEKQGLTLEHRKAALGAIEKIWKQKFADLPLPQGTLVTVPQGS